MLRESAVPKQPTKLIDRKPSKNDIKWAKAYDEMLRRSRKGEAVRIDQNGNVQTVPPHEQNLSDNPEDLVNLSLTLTSSGDIKIDFDKDDFEEDLKRFEKLKPQLNISNTTTASPITQSKKLSEVIASYCQHMETKDSWMSKSKSQAIARLNLLPEILGDIQASEVNYEIAAQVLETLKKLPKNHKTASEYARKSIAELTSQPHDESLSITTINTHIRLYGALFKYAQSRKWAQENPFMDMKIKDRDSREDKRINFSHEDLRKLFSTPLYTDLKFKNPWNYWLPLLGLYTGARLNELCQLKLEDITEIEDTLFIRIHAEDDEHKAKTKKSVRNISIHPHLTELGFAEYLDTLYKREEKNLFPELKPINGYHSHSATKWFGTYRKKVSEALFKSKPKKDFHSFRDTLITELVTKGVSEDLAAWIVGHSSGKTTGVDYKGKINPHVIKETINKIDFKPIIGHVTSYKPQKPHT